MASLDNHRWGPGEPIPLIRDHSLAKHRMLGEYLKHYVATLVKNPRIDCLPITIVDGFAGGNRYVDQQGSPRPGSPSIILDAMQDAEAATKDGGRRKPSISTTITSLLRRIRALSSRSWRHSGIPFMRRRSMTTSS